MKLQFSLRMLFVVLTLIGVAIGWIVYQLNWIRQRHEVAKNHHMVVGYLGGGPMITYVKARSEAPWPLRWLGEKGYVAINVDENETDSELARIQMLFPEAAVTRTPANN